MASTAREPCNQGAQMNRAVIARLAICGGVLVALAGCGEDGPRLPFGGSGDRETASERGERSSVQLVERDVEAPEVFQLTEAGLWDGRPSLGGVWVAHPDADDPERVIIRNEDNDSFVIGALFRRERENPGPALQVSSDAASALEMIAGQPATLNVTALRREEEPEEPAEAEAGEIEQSALDDPEAVAEAAIDGAESAEDEAPAAPPEPSEAPPEPEAGSLERPYIQIGIFSREENAEGAANQMRDGGMVPTVREETTQGRTSWRVIVGPARTESERATLLEKVRELGFTDAYPVRR